MDAIFGRREDHEPFTRSAARRGLREVARVREVLDRLERELVLAARAERRSWSAIAADLGVAKATALRRHRAADPVTAARERARAADPWLRELAELRALARGGEPPQTMS